MMKHNYDLLLSERFEIWLAKVFGVLPEDEKRIYDELNTLESILHDSTDLELLHVCRNRTLPGAYFSIYSSCHGQRFKPYLHARINRITEAYDEKIKSLEYNK